MDRLAAWLSHLAGSRPVRRTGTALFPRGITAIQTTDDLVPDRRGLLAGPVAAGEWAGVRTRDNAENALRARCGLYAVVVWEPAGQIAGHATVWHTHLAENAVRWMDLEAGDGQWMPAGGPPRFAAGHAWAVIISADARVLDPREATLSRSADLPALLELGPARPYLQDALTRLPSLVVP